MPARSTAAANCSRRRSGPTAASRRAQGAPVKNNRQLPENSHIVHELGDLVLAALERHPMFISAALPARVYPPMFNRYEGGEHFGSHVDNAVRLLPGTSHKIRTDVSATLFLAQPGDYDGGELLVEDTYGTHSVKLPAGDLVLYPATSLHRVTPVTRGSRLALSQPLPVDARELGIVLQKRLELDKPASRTRVVPARTVQWKDGPLQQPEQ